MLTAIPGTPNLASVANKATLKKRIGNIRTFQMTPELEAKIEVLAIDPEFNFSSYVRGLIRKATRKIKA